MPISQTDQLYSLIKSLDKAEKRNFKLYVNRLNSNANVKFLRLFDLLDRMPSFDEEAIRRDFHKTGTHQLANLKRHLYTQILKSLRLIHNQKEIDLQIRELLDFAKILYGKGLYLQALKLLDRCRHLSTSANQDVLLFEVLEFEKMIESRHITRSRKVANKVESLIEASNRQKKVIASASDLANLNLKIHGLYIKIGHVKDEKSHFVVKDYFHSNLPELNWQKLGFFERVYLHQSYVWYYYTILDFPHSYRHTIKWIELFEAKPIMIEKDPDLFMRGLHYCLTNLYYMRHYDAFDAVYQKFNRFYEDYHAQFNRTSELIYFIYGGNARLNDHFLRGDFEKSLALERDIKRQSAAFELTLDSHRQIVFVYKIAWMYFAVGRYEEAIDRLNYINNLKKEHLRTDMQCYTRLLLVLAHFDLGNYELVDNLIPTVLRFFKRTKESNVVVEDLLQSLKKYTAVRTAAPIKSWTKLHQRFLKYQSDYYLKRIFIYFHFAEWIESKSEHTTIGTIVRKHYERRQQPTTQP